MMPQVNPSDKFSRTITFLKEELDSVWPGTVSTSFVQNIISTLDYVNGDLSSVLKEATLQQAQVSGNDQTSVALEKKYHYKSINLSYFDLYEVLISLLNRISRTPNRHDDLAKALLKTLCFTLVFVEENTRIDTPALVAGMLYQIDEASSEIQECFMNALCKDIIPVCFGVVADENFKALDDVLSIIMLVLECVQEVSLHFQLIETLMMFKENLWIDIMSVISLSDGISRVYSTQLLFHYWPHLHCPSPKEHKLSSNNVYKPSICDNPLCQSLSSMKTATTMIIDPRHSAKVANKPPPLYLCNTCTQVCLTDPSNLDCVDIVLPAQCITYKCENKHCLDKDSVATVTLLGSKSAFAEGDRYISQTEKHNLSWHYDNHMMRYCGECYSNLQHVIGRLNLAVQIAPISAWDKNNSTCSRVIVDAIICLLTEDVDAAPRASASGETCKRVDGCGRINSPTNNGVYPCEGCLENVGLQNFPENLTHFGVWLLVSLCPPQSGIDQALVSQLIAAVLVWYKKKSRLSSDDDGNRLENMKSTILFNWLKEMREYYFKIFLNCLLPNPPPDARVRGNWDSIYPLLYQYKNGLEFLSVLGPYSIINFELWECLVPCWMMALCENLSSEDLEKLEPTLNMLFDTEMSPLGFEPDRMFDFILRNFNQSELTHHEDALEWLQLLCEVKVSIPFPRVIEMLLVSNSSLQFVFQSSSSLASDTEVKSVEARRYCCLPGLTYGESSKIITRSCQPGVDSLADIIEAMYTSTTEILDDSGQDKTHTLSVTNEHKKSLSRSGSARASKRIKAVLLKPKRSLTRRYSPRSHEDHAGDEKQVPPSLRTPPTPSLTHPKDKVGSERKLSAKWKHARVVGCYVDMVDIVYQQLQLHEQASQFDRSTLVVKLLCSLLWNVLQYNENRTFSKDNLSIYETIELEFTGDFCDLAAKLLAFILPTEIKTEKVETPKEWSYFVDPVAPTPQSSFTDRDLHNLNPHVQLLYLLIKVLEHYDSDMVITASVIRSISLLCINGDVFGVLEKHKIEKDFDYRMFISSLWKQLDVRSPDILKMSVAVLFEVIDSIDDAWEHQFQLLNSSFANSKPSTQDRNIDAWNKEYQALHRIHTLLMFLSHYGDDRLQRRSPVTHVVAYAVALLLSVLDSKHSAVHIQAKFIIDALSLENLKMAYQCLQYEYDASLRDRTFIISIFLQLHQLRPDASPLSMARFSHLMDVLSREVNQHRDLAPVVQFARSDLSSASLPLYFRTSNAITFNEWLRKAGLANRIDADFISRIPGKTSQPVGGRSPHELSSDASDTENDVFDKENEFGEDRNTVDSIMRAMCRYMVGCEEEVSPRVQSKDEHNFFTYFRNWIGFQDKFGLITKDGAVLRKAVGVNTLLKNLPNIMDSNLPLGNILLPKILCFLIVIIEMPHHFSSHPPSIGSTGHDLAILLPHDQVAWLKTLQVIMYKYTLNADEMDQLSHLLNVCMNVLMWEYHCCWTNTPQSPAREKGKKSDKPAGAKPIKKRTLERLGKRFAFDGEPAKNTPTYFNNSRVHDVDEAAFPLLVGTASLSNRQDESVAQSSHIAANVAEETPSCSTSDYQQIQNLSAKGKLDGGGASVGESISKASSLKGGGNREDSYKNALLATTECKQCKVIRREYDVQTICLSIANLCQFVRVYPTAAVKLLPQLLSQLAFIAEPLCDEQSSEPTQSSSTQTDIALVAKQSIRCILHHLADARIFSCLFSMSFSKESSFLRVLIVCLRDYHLFHCTGVLQRTLEDLPDDLKRPEINIRCLLGNMSSYLHHLHNEAVLNINWQPLANLFSAFFLKLHTYMVEEGLKQIDVVLLLMLNLLKAPILGHSKAILLEPCSKILSTSVSKFNFSSKLLYELCEAGCELFAKEKDKLHLSRCVVSKLISVLKMNSFAPNKNILHLLQVVLLDGGSRVNPLSSCDHSNEKVMFKRRCYVMDCTRTHLSDFLDVLSDGNFFFNLNNGDGSKPGQGGACLISVPETHHMGLKLAIAQTAAFHLHLHFNHTYDFVQFNSINTHVIQALHYVPPSTQCGPKQQAECLVQIKKLSWVLLGTLSHLGLERGSADNLWLPVPFSKGTKFSKIVQIVLTGLMDRSKGTDTNLTALFHIFLFCQLWTVYCEQLSFFTSSPDPPVSFTTYNPVGENGRSEMLLLEFWTRLTPSLLILLQDGKDPQLVVSAQRHIESLMECLQIYNSPILNKFSPLWLPMLNEDVNKEKSCVGNHGYFPRDPLSTSHSSSTCGFLEERGGYDCGSAGLIENAAKLNAKKVLVIVERINRKLVDFERNSLCVI